MVALSVCASSACRARAPARVRLGTDERVRYEYAREPIAWRVPAGAALANELEAARVAIEEAGMVDPARGELRRCGGALGFRVGETFFGLDGSPSAVPVQRCGPPLTTADFERELSRGERSSRDAVSRAILLRLGVAGDSMESEPVAQVDRWSTTRAWAARSWANAVRGFAGTEPDVDDPVARTSLGAARYAIGAFERSGADGAAVSRAFPFAAIARELDGQRWTLSQHGLEYRPRLHGFRQEPLWTHAPALVLNGWHNSNGEPLLPVTAPRECPANARATRALRYRPTEAWFANAMTREVLVDWTALEPLLRALSTHTSLTRVALAPCADDEVLRPARGYEVAYVVLAAALGFDALAPAEYARFVAGDRRLLLDIEARFREHIQRISPTDATLARVVLDQRATRAGWKKAAETLLQYNARAPAQPGADLALRRNRDAARLIAAARGSDDDRPAQCALLLTALTVDPSIAEEHALPIARSLMPSSLPAERSHERMQDVRCRIRVLNKLVDANAIEAASLLDPLLVRASREAIALEPSEVLAALVRSPNAIVAWRPDDALAETINAQRWISSSAFGLYARNDGLRRWALALLQSAAPYSSATDAWQYAECAQARPTTRSQQVLCLLGNDLWSAAFAQQRAEPPFRDVRTRAMLWLTPPPR